MLDLQINPKKLTQVRLGPVLHPPFVPEQCGVHVEQEEHAADVEVQIVGFVEGRRDVRGDDFGHGEGGAHHY